MIETDLCWYGCYKLKHNEMWAELTSCSLPSTIILNGCHSIILWFAMLMIIRRNQQNLKMTYDWWSFIISHIIKKWNMHDGTKKHTRSTDLAYKSWEVPHKLLINSTIKCILPIKTFSNMIIWCKLYVIFC